MDNDTTIPADLTPEELEGELEKLLEQVERVSGEIDAASAEAKKNLDALEEKVDETMASLTERCTKLDHIDTEAGDELDELILERASELTAE